MSKKKATDANTAARSRAMKLNLDTGVEVCDNKVKKKQYHTTNEKPNKYLDIFNETNILICKTDLQGKVYTNSLLYDQRIQQNCFTSF